MEHVNMDLNELNKLTATNAIQLIDRQEISPVEYMNACAAQINKVEKEIHAWKHIDLDFALEQARQIDSKITESGTAGKLRGIPVGIKDIFNTHGMPTCMGSEIWEGFRPGNDARAVEYIRWEDGVIMGKTVTAEFAVHHPGPTLNPHNREHSPGTSSSGSAAAVASNMVPLALGTQTAGSTIRPASYCGIYGMKPSFGLIPRTGILKTLDTLDHVSFLSRSIDDLVLMLDVMRVKGQNFPYVHQYVDQSGSINKEAKPSKKWKIGFVKTPAWDSAEDYAKKAITDFVSRLDKYNNIEVEASELPDLFNQAHDIHNLIYTKALSYYFQDEYNEHPDKISPIFADMVEKGKNISKADYLNGLENQRILNRQCDEFLSGYDAVITLSTSASAPKGIYGRDLKDSCLIWTLCHVPAINLPVFKCPEGLPFGAQIITACYNDYRLLDFAKYLEKEGLLS